MRHEDLDSEPRKHGVFLVCISSHFSLGGAHCTASYLFLSILIIELVLLLFYTRLLCMITPYLGLVGRCGAFIRFSSYFEFFLRVSPQSFGLPKTEVRPLRISYYFVSLLTNYLAIVSRYFKYIISSSGLPTSRFL
jgi:hypothetical protein